MFYPSIGENLSSSDVYSLFALFDGYYDVDNSFVQTYTSNSEQGYDIICYYLKAENNTKKTYILRLR